MGVQQGWGILGSPLEQMQRSVEAYSFDPFFAPIVWKPLLKRILDFLESGLPQSEPLKLDSMLGPKLYAIVEEIGGQIYILSRKCLNLSVKRPLFEVWNPETEKSRALPNPPSFSQGLSCLWQYYCLWDGVFCL